MRIAIFDYMVVANNPAGGCHLRMIKGLCAQHDFTVFAVSFENPDPARVKFVRIPAIKRPLALLFISFHLLAPLYYLWYQLWTGQRFDVVQAIESNFSFSDICYAHFCHKAFLKSHGKRVLGTGLRSRARWLDHWLHALLEPRVFRRAKLIVVPSKGLLREIIAVYPFTAGKIITLENPVDIDGMRRPADFDRDAFRRTQGLGEKDLVVAFAALGHFERKGLPQLLEAWRSVDVPELKLLVIGGTQGLVAQYQQKCRELGVEGRVKFVGMQRDVRPFLWCSDAFALPSFYETFSLATFEAAAAGLSVIVSRLNGVEDFLIPGVNGILVETTPGGIGDGLRRWVGMTPDERRAIGSRGAESVRRFDAAQFIQRWGALYAKN